MRFANHNSPTYQFVVRFPDVVVPLRIPEKPALEGLEAKWTPIWEASGVYRFDRSATARRRVLDRHASTDRQRVAPRRPRLLVHAYRRRRPVSADAGQGGLLSDGMGRQRTADRAPRPELLRRPLRSVAAVRSVVRAARQAGQAAGVGVAPELHRALRAPDDRRRKGLRAPVEVPRPLRRLVEDLRHDQPARAARVAAGVPPSGASRPGVPARGAHAVGRRLQDGGRAGRARGPRAAGRVPSHQVCASPSTPDVAAGFSRTVVEIETTRPELIPACVALVAHPDDERYRPLFGREAITPLFGVRVPIKPHPLADPEKGSGIAMICTFGDITDVTWWRELSLPVRAVIQPDGTLGPVAWGAPGWESADAARAQQSLRSAGASFRGEGAAGHRRRSSASPAIWWASRGRSRTPSSSTKRAIVRSRSSPAGSGSSRRWTSGRS